MISYNEAVEKIFSLRRLGMKLGLENVKRFLSVLGNPQMKLKIFHVAGSNGKGSTVAFLSSILQEAGYKVGMFTSPHFVDFRERIKINGKKIEKEYVTEFVSQHIDFIEEKRITFFEITTAMAFRYFYEQNVDYAVIETGLGGRLDATNTANPIAEIITSVSLEHTRILGDTIEKIAREKAGIIKQNGKVFCGFLPSEALQEIGKISEEKNAECFPLKNFALAKNDFVKLKFDLHNEITLYKTGLRGAHQLRNASLAVLTLRKIFPKLEFEIINNGLMNVVKNTGLSGRFEIVSESPLVIFDSAHNVESVESFVNEFEKNYSSHCSIKRLIYGALRDKNVTEILKILGKTFDEILFTKIDFYRALTHEELHNKAKNLGLKKIKILENPTEYISQFIKTPSSDCLVVLGSIYLLGEIKKELQTTDG